MGTDRDKERVRRLFEGAFNEGRLDLADETIDANDRFQQLGMIPPTPAPPRP